MCKQDHQWQLDYLMQVRNTWSVSFWRGEDNNSHTLTQHHQTVCLVTVLIERLQAAAVKTYSALRTTETCCTNRIMFNRVSAAR